MILNAEHYVDPTASSAVMKANKPTYDAKPAFVQGDHTPPPPPVFVDRNRMPLPISEMEMEDLKPLLKNCHKCGGDPQKCFDCFGGCAFGTRAIELMNQKKKEEDPMEEARRKGRAALKTKAMLEYQAAIESGDMIQYVIDHSKHREGQELQTIRGMARGKIRRWRKDYGALIKETPEVAKKFDTRLFSVAEPEPEEDLGSIHLMQMPCLSKKIAAEKAAEQASENEQKPKVEVAVSAKLPDHRADNPIVAGLFTSKLDELRRQMESIQSQIDAIEEAAGILGIAV